MESFKQFNEKALHKMFKKMDVKIAQGIHKKLIQNQVIGKTHKFGDIIESEDIDGHFAHSNVIASHNYREEIESYNSIVKRNKDEII